MTRRDRPSIPIELHQIWAQQIYEERIALGIDGTPEEDWEQARRELEERFWEIRDWRIQKAIEKKSQQLRAFIRRLWQSFKALVNGIWKILTLPYWMLTQLPQKFANENTRQYALDVVKTIISSGSFIAVIIAGFQFLYTYNKDIQERRLAQEKLIADRKTKAIDQIGKVQDEVVIDGIYSLEEIAKDSPQDQWNIMLNLSQFIQRNSPIPAEIRELKDNSEKKVVALEQLKPVNIQVQAALTVIGRRNPFQDHAQKYETTKFIDLSNSNLRSADLRDADLRDANLRNANLSSANLRNANLRNANLSSANLRNANLSSANLSSANLSSVNLSSANLSSAIFVFANLSSANLEDANFIFADLSRSNLRNANLSSANLSNANLSNANLSNANLVRAKNLSNTQIKSACFWEKAIFANEEQANQQKIEEIRQDKASDPTIPPDCSRWER